jgi:hypothetical protein
LHHHHHCQKVAANGYSVLDQDTANNKQHATTEISICAPVSSSSAAAFGLVGGKQCATLAGPVHPKQKF